MADAVDTARTADSNTDHDHDGAPRTKKIRVSYSKNKKQLVTFDVIALRIGNRKILVYTELARRRSHLFRAPSEFPLSASNKDQDKDIETIDLRHLGDDDSVVAWVSHITTGSFHSSFDADLYRIAKLWKVANFLQDETLQNRLIRNMLSFQGGSWCPNRETIAMVYGAGLGNLYPRPGPYHVTVLKALVSWSMEDIARAIRGDMADLHRMFIEDLRRIMAAIGASRIEANTTLQRLYSRKNVAYEITAFGILKSSLLHAMDPPFDEFYDTEGEKPPVTIVKVPHDPPVNLLKDCRRQLTASNTSDPRRQAKLHRALAILSEIEELRDRLVRNRF